MLVWLIYSGDLATLMPARPSMCYSVVVGRGQKICATYKTFAQVYLFTLVLQVYLCCLVLFVNFQGTFYTSLLCNLAADLLQCYKA